MSEASPRRRSQTGNVWFLGEPTDGSVATTSPGHRIGLDMAACFPELDPERIQPRKTRRHRHEGAVEELREEHYNATITHFEPTHSDLWVLRVKPDHGGTDYTPGQYATLGLGYWEERVDDAIDPNLGDRWFKLIRRSYSISSRVLDDHGYLVDEGGLDELEFYIVLVPPTEDNIPELTPRLALKRPGDRIYLGPKVAGRYTLDSITNPAGTVMFFSTGTGEAPHNAMITELLRKGHHGPIVSAVSVRNSIDLGYEETHRELERRHHNYHYLPMPTREPDIAKRYIQDLIKDGDFARMGVSLDPATTHVFMCGNPAMIGIPDEDGVFPATVGVVELLVERGFTIDKRKQPGKCRHPLRHRGASAPRCVAHDRVEVDERQGVDRRRSQVDRRGAVAGSGSATNERRGSRWRALRRSTTMSISWEPASPGATSRRKAAAGHHHAGKQPHIHQRLASSSMHMCVKEGEGSGSSPVNSLVIITRMVFSSKARCEAFGFFLRSGLVTGGPSAVEQPWN